MADQQEIESAHIERAIAGDTGAQERLYRCYQRRVYALAYRLTGNTADAQDITQDAFIRCFEALHQYRGDAPFWGWLKQLAVRTALMRLRAQRRWRWTSFEHHSYEAGGEAGAGVANLASGPEAQAMDRQDLQQALSHLNTTARAVIYLYHGEGYSHAEIAALWGKSVSFSKSQLARAQHKLRRILQRGVTDPNQAAATPSATAVSVAAAPTTVIPDNSSLRVALQESALDPKSTSAALVLRLDDEVSL